LCYDYIKRHTEWQLRNPGGAPPAPRQDSNASIVKEPVAVVPLRRADAPLAPVAAALARVAAPLSRGATIRTRGDSPLVTAPAPLGTALVPLLRGDPASARGATCAAGGAADANEHPLHVLTASIISHVGVFTVNSLD
jgi:hypothetical protein